MLVLDLYVHGLCPPVHLRDTLHLDELPGAHVAPAQVPLLPALHQVVQRLRMVIVRILRYCGTFKKALVLITKLSRGMLYCGAGRGRGSVLTHAEKAMHECDTYIGDKRRYNPPRNAVGVRDRSVGCVNIAIPCSLERK